MIGKQHFTLLYDRAQRKAITSWNIISGWSKTGLRPLNPERVPEDMQKPDMAKHCTPLIINSDKTSFPPVLKTPKTFESFASLRRDIEMNIAGYKALDAHTKLSIQKVVNAGANVFADRAIFLNETCFTVRLQTLVYSRHETNTIDGLQWWYPLHIQLQ
jgi:hypothetical protein